MGQVYDKYKKHFIIIEMQTFENAAIEKGHLNGSVEEFPTSKKAWTSEDMFFASVVL